MSDDLNYDTFGVPVTIAVKSIKYNSDGGYSIGQQTCPEFQTKFMPDSFLNLEYLAANPAIRVDHLILEILKKSSNIPLGERNGNSHL